MASFPREGTFHSRTSAAGHVGFPPLLSDMLAQALDCNTSPEYMVFQSEPVPHLHRYQAKVQICPGPAEDGKPLIFLGRPMPTPVLAIQTAAAEAIARLPSLFPRVAEMREFRYFPSASSTGWEFSHAAQEGDPAIVRLVQFISAQGMMIGSILGEFQAIDRDATRVVTEAYREARQAASQIADPMPSGPVLSSQPVPWLKPGTANLRSIDRTICHLHGFLPASSATPAGEPQPIEVLDDEDRDWLSLRPPGEPQQD